MDAPPSVKFADVLVTRSHNVAGADRSSQVCAAQAASTKFLAPRRPTRGSSANSNVQSYEVPTSMSAPIKRNSERGMSRIVVIILIATALILLFIAILVVAPNLTHSRKAATESAAYARVRSLDADQVTYYSSFANIGYAPDLASLGPGPDGKCAASGTPAHACIIDAVLGNSACTGTSWCTQAGYKFNIEGICANGKCTDFVITATPVDLLNGSRNYCATSDSVLRDEVAAPKSDPFTLVGCKVLVGMQ